MDSKQKHIIPLSHTPDSSRPGSPSPGSNQTRLLLAGASFGSYGWSELDPEYVPSVRSDSPPSGSSRATARSAEVESLDPKVADRGESIYWLLEKVSGQAPRQLGLGVPGLFGPVKRVSLDATGLARQKVDWMKAFFGGDVEEHEWCLICTRTTNKAPDKFLAPEDRKGYIQLNGGTGNPSNKVIGSHMIACALQHGIPEGADVAVGFGTSASHLCGRSTCVNPNHLCWESLELNESRKRCHAWVSTTGPEGKWPRIHVNACVHTPRCIRFIPGVSMVEYTVNPGAYVIDIGDPRVA